VLVGRIYYFSSGGSAHFDNNNRAGWSGGTVGFGGVLELSDDHISYLTK
jgi:hypothetical protein